MFLIMLIIIITIMIRVSTLAIPRVSTTLATRFREFCKTCKLKALPKLALPVRLGVPTTLSTGLFGERASFGWRPVASVS